MAKVGHGVGLAVEARDGRWMLRWRQDEEQPDGTVRRVQRSKTVHTVEALRHLTDEIEAALRDQGWWRPDARAAVTPLVANAELAALDWIAWKVGTRGAADNTRGNLARSMKRVFTELRDLLDLGPDQAVPVSALTTANLNAVTARWRVRLDARVERPWLRGGFRHADLLGWTLAERRRLVAAALTLARGCLADGAPPGAATIGSFGAWSAVVGGILASAGAQGFLDDRDEPVDAATPEESAWQAFVARLAEAHGAAEVDGRALLALAVETGLWVPDARRARGAGAVRDRPGEAPGPGVRRVADRGAAGREAEGERVWAGRGHMTGIRTFPTTGLR